MSRVSPVCAVTGLFGQCVTLLLPRRQVRVRQVIPVNPLPLTAFKVGALFMRGLFAST